MTNSLLEAGKIALIEIELVDEHVEVAALVAKVHADSSGIIDNDKGEDSRERKGTGVNALEVGNASQKRYYERRMGTGHVTVGKCILDIKSVFVGVESKFDELSQNADGNGNQEYEV